MYPTPNIRSENISWLYDVLAENWIRLGLPEETRESIRNGAFYTTIVRPGLRLISLNMNYCAQDNFWLYINSTDPLDQLQWVKIEILNEQFVWREAKKSQIISFSLFNGYNTLKIIKKKFTSSVIIHRVRV